jgi:uncharacterized membrane protein
MTEEQNKPTVTNGTDEGKKIAIISYITLIGTIIAYFMNNDKKNKFAAFHIRQMIGINLLYIVNYFVVTRISGYASWIISILILILWVFGFAGAIQGQEKKAPVVGDMFQDWFKSI